MPLPSQTYETDAGPFGNIDGGVNGIHNNTAYEQYQWLAADLAAVDRSKTPWVGSPFSPRITASLTCFQVFAMSHRPMYSTGVSSYQAHMRAAFEDLFLANGVDAYFAGHIHWYERMWPLMKNDTGVDTASIVNRNTYYTNPGVSMTHITNGQAGNIESHSVLGDKSLLSITNFLDDTHFGFGTLTVHNKSAVTWDFLHGDGSGVGDSLTLLKRK